MSGQSQTAGNFTKKGIARYLLLPEIFPRAKELGGSGFGYFAFLIATVYQAVRILPATHPYTQPGNIGTFGIRQVIAAAANHVKLSRKNIDQVIVFFAVIAAVILLALQFLSLIVLIFSGDAFAAGGAAGGGFDGIFKTVKPEKDIAFLMMDYVFGIPDFFGSEAIKAGPTAFHLALQAMFQFYNLAILIVAVLIFLYFVLVVVTETALSGTPFGKRFNTIYAPLRLVFAIGLLVPLNHGFNASQYIVLAAARAGSGMATNGWIIFNRELTNPIGAESKSLIAEPKPPENAGIDQFMTVAHTCRKAYELVEPSSGGTKIEIKPYIVTGGGAPVEYESIDYQTAIAKFKGGNIPVVFGEKGDTDEHKKYSGVIPYCGIITIPITIRNPGSLSGEGEGGGAGGAAGGGGGSGSSTYGDWGGANGETGPELIQARYYWLAKFAWQRGFNEAVGERFAYATKPSNPNPCHRSSGRGSLGDGDSCKTKYSPPSTIKSQIIQDTQFFTAAAIREGVQTARDAVNLKVSQDILDRGWGGAGIWYNQIAELNGTIVDSSQNFPTISKWPMLMENILNKKIEGDGKTDVCSRFDINLSESAANFPGGAIDRYIASAMASSYRYWYCDSTTEEKGLTANIFWDAMQVIFGTNGLFGLRENNADEVHPLAQLTAVGKSLVESSIRNMAYSMATAVAGGFMGAIAPHWGAPIQAMSGFFVSIAMIGLTAGFILFYILPFLPFIYFFFAVGAWVKTIFEAMVGAPLWALAHLRIDGEGFPGRSAANGYFLIFEIFVRPILTLFGLLGGMAIFTAMAVILNDLFDFVVFQVTGTELAETAGTGGSTGAGDSVYTGEYESFRRSIVDEFFYTVLYAMLLYMIGLASFKMIDLVPNNILRWMGAGVSSYADQAGDPKEGLVQYAAMGGYKIGGDILGATNKLGGGIGSAIGGVTQVGKEPG